jgi:predicted small lipoprotein YifL
LGEFTLSRISHIASPRVLALVFAMGTVAACGVKGDLEAPRSNASAAPAERNAGATVEPGVAMEQSVVRRGDRLEMFPKMPPPEWEKIGAKKSEETSTKRAPSKPLPSDRPFILDGLL